MPPDKRPFAAVAQQEHISDSDDGDDQRIDDLAEPAHPGASHMDSGLDRFGGKHPAEDYQPVHPHEAHYHVHPARQQQLLSAEERDEGAHSSPSAQQEMQHDHAQFDDTVGYHNNHHHLHAFRRQ